MILECFSPSISVVLEENVASCLPTDTNSDSARDSKHMHMHT